jgi:hypothetical protein
MTVVLTVMSGMDPHMISWDLGLDVIGLGLFGMLGRSEWDCDATEVLLVRCPVGARDSPSN